MYIFYLFVYLFMYSFIYLLDILFLNHYIIFTSNILYVRVDSVDIVY